MTATPTAGSDRVHRIEPIAGSLGARVTGIDLEQPDESTFDALKALLLEHLVVVLPGPVLDAGALARFASGLGRPSIHPVVPHVVGHPEVIEIRNFGKTKTLNEHWHSDVTFEARPPMYTLLQAHQVPSAGGDTMFANQYLAYEELSEGMRAMLGRLRAVHTGRGLARVMHRDAAPEAIHPVVRTHPESGRRALFVCRAFTRRFEGMTARESEPLLRFLFEHASRPHLTARHRWSPGDLVIWDNRCVQHYAIHDHGDAERVLLRVTIEGEEPV
jgi:taurine dioxygenase